jgi:N-acetylglucosaminyldiphosphoundecaprenol N-acetyl-beta-D-mannosaminyltransferase
VKAVLITNFCPFYRVKLFRLLAQAHDMQFLFFSDASEKNWEALNKLGGQDLPAVHLRHGGAGTLRMLARLWRILWRGEYDVVIQGISGRFVVPLSYTIARLRRKPIIIWTGFWHHPRTPFHRLTFPIVRHIYRHADALAAYGTHVATYLEHLGVPPERIFIAWNTADNTAYARPVSTDERATLRSELAIDDAPVVLFVGRLQKEKGVDVLLRAVAALGDEPTTLVIGRGPERDALEAESRALGLAKVRFLDYVPNEDLYRYYALACVVAVPSLTTPAFKEPWGLVVNEAMNQGTPVVASDAVGAAMGGLLRDGGNGLVVPEGDAAALAQALARVLADDDLRARMGQAALETIAGWTYERMARGFLDALDRCQASNWQFTTQHCAKKAHLKQRELPIASLAPKRCDVLGVNLAVTSYEDLLQRMQRAVAENQRLRINFCNVHVTMMAQRMPALRTALNHPDALTVPDGMPLVWAMRTWGEEIHDRVYGPDTFGLCMQRSQTCGFRHFLYGSTEETLNALQMRLRDTHPDAEIAGRYAPPFRALTEQEEDAVVAMINRSGANVLWVGLGAPKQEIWLNHIASQLTVPVIAAVGAAFDFHAGTVKQAPDWMQDRGLEWLYRLIQEPRRLWFRYCYYNPLFVLKFGWERVARRRRAPRQGRSE